MTTSKIALSLALLLTASAAIAAPKHVTHRQPAQQTNSQSAAYNAYGSARLDVTTKDGSVVDPYNHSQVKCMGGSCAPEWGLDSGE